MKITVTENIFINAFMASSRKDDFTVDALRALFAYSEECDDKDTELDVVGISCEYTEYATLEDIAEDYSEMKTLEGWCEDDYTWEQNAIEWLNDRTIVIEIPYGGYIISNF